MGCDKRQQQQQQQQQKQHNNNNNIITATTKMTMTCISQDVTYRILVYSTTLYTP
jgi:hypothetical protein